jgi:hypothetical protein
VEVFEQLVLVEIVAECQALSSIGYDDECSMLFCVGTLNSSSDHHRLLIVDFVDTNITIVMRKSRKSSKKTEKEKEET